jgi:hypothetical protein
MSFMSRTSTEIRLCTAGVVLVVFVIGGAVIISLLGLDGALPVRGLLCILLLVSPDALTVVNTGVVAPAAAHGSIIMGGA